jgi:predicted GNAT family acetyltransferase
MENGSALTSARNALVHEARYPKPVYWATVEDGGRVIGCAFRTPPHRLGVTALNETAIAAVIASVGQVYGTLSGVSGPEPTANVLAETWCRLRGGATRVRSRHRLYSLRLLIPPAHPPTGALRPASDADLALVRIWGEAFIREAGTEGINAEFFAQLVKAQKAYLWDDAQPRCLVAAVRQTPRASAIGVLFTPTEIRGRGYGTAAAAALSELIFKGGSTGCYLYADPEDKTVSRIVGGIGYQPVQDQADIDLE